MSHEVLTSFKRYFDNLITLISCYACDLLSISIMYKLSHRCLHDIDFKVWDAKKLVGLKVHQDVDKNVELLK